MTRISLRETYDNRSVIAQIAKVTDTAEDAAETVQQKAAEINDALTDVNAAVQAAEGAVTTANAASASAQQSAQTVAGYENRLGTVEGDIAQLNTDIDGVESGLNAVTVRVTTAEGNILTIQGQITALQTADGQNVKINRINEYAVGLTGNQTVAGIKSFVETLYELNNAPVIARSPNIIQGETPSSNINVFPWQIRDSALALVASTQFVDNQNGSRSLTLNIYDKNNVRHRVTLMTVNADGTETYPWS
jgi:hypothetical protein